MILEEQRGDPGDLQSQSPVEKEAHTYFTCCELTKVGWVVDIF